MSDISELARALADHAENVCRHYLSKGHPQGHYWRVGDVHNQPGQSLYVQLSGEKAGRWTDAATGQFGDLIDLIELNQGLGSKHEAINASRDFLALSHKPSSATPPSKQSPNPKPSHGDRARAIYSVSRHIRGTLAEAYLNQRGIDHDLTYMTLRFHPKLVYYERGLPKTELRSFPALIAGVADMDGALVAIQRTWLDTETNDKASVPQPRRSLGPILGHGVRFGQGGDVLIAGEGLETVLSVRMALPNIPMIAALSSTHLTQIGFPSNLKRLYGLIDNDAAGYQAQVQLAKRALAARIDFIALRAHHNDFNQDLMAFGLNHLRARLIDQLAPQDRP